MSQATEEVSPEKQALIKAANADWQPPSSKEKRYRLTIHRPPGDESKDVFVSVNFKAYQILFDEEVEVPESVVEALRQTRGHTVDYDKETGKMRPTFKSRFAFSAEAV